MTAWAILRFVKFVSVALFTVGVLGGVLANDAGARRRLSQQLGTLAMIGVLVGGYGLAKKTGASLGEPWISRSLLCGLVAYGTACWGGATRVRPVIVAVSVGALLSAFGWMSARTLGQAWLLGAAAPAVVATAVAIRFRPTPAQDADHGPATMQWFVWLARGEGVSLLLLFGLYMPLKHVAGINLDGGQGWFGWMHGVMQLLYLVALIVAGRVLGWSLPRQAIGFIASLLPLGTFWFERRIRAEPPASAS